MTAQAPAYPVSAESHRIETCLMAMLPQGFYMGIADRSAIEGFSLDPVEAAGLNPRAAAKRRDEYTMGRAAARAALKRLGISASGVGKDKSGAPLWPADIVGSITHKKDAALAVVAPARRCRSLGVDMESATDPISPDISRRICHPGEIPWVFEDPALTTLRLKLIFSAKESLFKAVNPFTGSVFPLPRIRLRWDAGRNGFDIELPEEIHRALPSTTLSPIRFGITAYSVITLFILW